jgi:hypothetical protein
MLPHTIDFGGIIARLTAPSRAQEKLSTCSPPRLRFIDCGPS